MGKSESGLAEPHAQEHLAILALAGCALGKKRVCLVGEWTSLRAWKHVSLRQERQGRRVPARATRTTCKFNCGDAQGNPVIECIGNWQGPGNLMADPRK
jgi:hypothetical protein